MKRGAETQLPLVEKQQRNKLSDENNNIVDLQEFETKRQKLDCGKKEEAGEKVQEEKTTPKSKSKKEKEGGKAKRKRNYPTFSEFMAADGFVMFNVESELQRMLERMERMDKSQECELKNTAKILMEKILKAATYFVEREDVPLFAVKILEYAVGLDVALFESDQFQKWERLSSHVFELIENKHE